MPVAPVTTSAPAASAGSIVARQRLDRSMPPARMRGAWPAQTSRPPPRPDHRARRCRPRRRPSQSPPAAFRPAGPAAAPVPDCARPCRRRPASPWFRRQRPAPDRGRPGQRPDRLGAVLHMSPSSGIGPGIGARIPWPRPKSRSSRQGYCGHRQAQAVVRAAERSAGGLGHLIPDAPAARQAAACARLAHGRHRRPRGDDRRSSPGTSDRISAVTGACDSRSQPPPFSRDRP